MSILHNRRSLDPRWPWHQRSVPIGMMNAVCEIFRRSGDSQNYGYDPLTGGLTDEATGGFPQMILLYRGQVRAATNKDWRARTRTIRGESGTQHAVRFQVPIKSSPPIHAHDVLRVVSSPPDPELLHFIFHVRNPMMSSNAWIRNLLCDVDVAHPQVLPSPYDGEPVVEEMIPDPFFNCTKCG